MASDDKPIGDLKTSVIPDHDDALLSTKTLAVLRDVGPNRIEKERLTGDGPPWVCDGRLVRYRLGDYRAWVAAKQRFTSTSEPTAA